MKLNMKDNLLRIAEKIKEYLDAKATFLPQLEIFNSGDMPLTGTWRKKPALIKHPDYW